MIQERSNAQTAVKGPTDVSVTQMMQTIARAYLATGQKDAARKMRTLNYVQLTSEYHWALVTLEGRGLLSAEEKREMVEYASEFLSPLSKA